MFLVAATRNPEKIKQAIQSLDLTVYELRFDLFVIKYNGTARELADKLGIREGTTGSGLVVSFDGYSGRAPSDFWEWMKVQLSPNG
ncbi:hypothetical protein MTX26_10125 [Bradyrhizobium sp. ISRA443]|uniref:hypothetical protein n=1 Tax=unclassified Bradyrhizobium TaxID=2631580 RepID=UPI002479F438|nr:MULTISPECIES: hypothetical protein [unclassified Bradyrhizobium]WGR90995.1 hypothetical protein MTX20_20460 [Bradyrhizobium sp. ISRA435]WGS01143.1 hypothetical protein MTX23_10120 [Bradyrhizobium sp. ISRA436]WGS08030.1 hypothetical protein MTX18_10125 [Bradyrhizobium sp. ISRA437]WGS14918.1 hypothetical protein MTX26_10125 [Bradyrhizobium sp. ISRA443]